MNPTPGPDPESGPAGPLRDLPERLRRLLLVRRSFYVYSLFLLRIVGTAFSVLFTALLGRGYGAEGAGLFYVYRSWFNLMGAQLTGNYDVYITRRVVALQEQGRVRAAYAFVKTAMIVFGLAGITVVGITMASPAYRLIPSLDSDDARRLLLFAGLGGSAFLIIQSLSAGLRAFNRAPASLALQFVIPPAVASLALLAAITTPRGADSEWPALAYTASHVLAASFGVILWRLLARRVNRAVAPELSRDPLQESPRVISSNFLNRSALTFILTGWISNLLEYLPMYFLAVLGSLKEIAFYGVADRLVSVSSTILFSLGSDYLPRFSRLYIQGDIGTLRKEFVKSQIYSLLLFFPFMLAFVVFPRQILGLFGGDFQQSYTYLFILLIGDAINAATGLVGPLLYAIEDETFVLRAQAWSLLLFAGTLWAGWSAFGGLGVAAAASAFLGMRNLVFFLRVFFLLRRREAGPV